MISRRNTNAWIWVALVALTAVSVAQAEAATQTAKTCAHPVLAFFSGGHGTEPASLQEAAQHRSVRRFQVPVRSGFAGACLALLPVFFIGLVSPLNQLSPRSVLCLGGVPSAPLLPGSFQRPPPLQFA